MSFTRVSYWAASVACLSMVLAPATASAAANLKPTDVVMHQGNTLVGQVVDAQGKVQPMAMVTLANHESEVARVRADENGKFAVSGLRGGVYQVSSRGHEAIYRVWAPNTAPPVANQGVTVVVDKDVVRGQYGNTPGPFTSFAQWCADHPLMCAGAIGAAIAIPIAVADDDDPAS